MFFFRFLLKIGLKAEISLEAYPEQIFSATVVRVSPVLDAASRTKQVILNFDKKDSRVNAGMFAKVKLYTVDYVNVVGKVVLCIPVLGRLLVPLGTLMGKIAMLAIILGGFLMCEVARRMSK